MIFFPENITLQYNISQLLGFVALALVCVGFFCKKERMMIYQILANITIVASLILLNATFGWISTIIANVRFAVYYYLDKRNIKVPVWFLCVITFLLVSTCVNFGKGNYELLQMTAILMNLMSI